MMYEYSATLIKIVDGDTVDVLIDLGFNTTKKERVRLLGIDTPESATKDLTEKKLGLEAKEYIIYHIPPCQRSPLSRILFRKGSYT